MPWPPGTLAEAAPSTSVREACEAWIADARAGIVRTKGGDPFKPATLRAYHQALRLRVYPTLAEQPFYRLRRVHLQDLVDCLVAGGTARATINNMVGALGAIYGRAVHRDELATSPTVGVKNRTRRRVPIVALLREHLATQRLAQSPGEKLCFARDAGRPFRHDRLQARADTAWAEAGLTRLTLHDCRHTFASLAIAAGVNAKALSSYMGHSGVSITLDRYGHLMPGNEAEAATLLDTYLSAGTG